MNIAFYLNNIFFNFYFIIFLFLLLLEIVDYGYIDDDGGYEEEDEDIKNDPIYQVKINVC